MKKVIVIVGPTGVGKTKLSIALAKKLKSEIISGDSMQIYKGMDIGTAKIKESEKEGIVHHLIDIKEISEKYSVYDFQHEVRKKIDEISEKKMIPILVGGTGLYLKAALYDYHFEKEETIKDSNASNYENMTNDELYQLLVNLDKLSAQTIHPNNRKRVIRAINIAKNNENTKSDMINKQAHLPIYDLKVIGLTTNRELLYALINKRVDKMIADGLVDEVKRIYDIYKDNVYYSLLGISYKELFLYFKGEISYDEAVELIKKNTRNYAKRQYTWFKNQFDVKWFNVNFDDFSKTINEVFAYLGVNYE